MKLSKEQQQKVNENMGLVGKVIKDKVHGTNQLGIYSYDDIYQIGCIGLCKAAYTDKGGCFTTYAYRIIWNEICNALIYATRRNLCEQMTDPDIMSGLNASAEFPIELNVDLYAVLERLQDSASGVTAKGIQALRLMSDGYSCKEIGEMMHAAPNHVTAWVSKARKYLKTQPDILALYAAYIA